MSYDNINSTYIQHFASSAPCENVAMPSIALCLILLMSSERVVNSETTTPDDHHWWNHDADAIILLETLLLLLGDTWLMALVLVD
jgi:hypothetical protein